MILDLGLIDYKRCLTIQREFVSLRRRREVEDCLIMAEHLPVFTIGRTGKCYNLLVGEDLLSEKGVRLLRVDRGGDITFHGPGQVVFYPIVDLGVRGGDLHRYMRDLEEAAINFLSIYSVAGARVAERTGVWVSGRKIASIGIAARNWITYHGISININVDLKWFSMINPCGIKDIKATSLAELLGEEIDMECAKREALRQLSAIFNFTEAHEESPAMA